MKTKYSVYHANQFKIIDASINEYDLTMFKQLTQNINDQLETKGVHKGIVRFYLQLELEKLLITK
jgi:hypothetical protein